MGLLKDLTLLWSTKQREILRLERLIKTAWFRIWNQFPQSRDLKLETRSRCGVKGVICGTDPAWAADWEYSVQTWWPQLWLFLISAQAQCYLNHSNSCLKAFMVLKFVFLKTLTCIPQVYFRHIQGTPATFTTAKTLVLHENVSLIKSSWYIQRCSYSFSKLCSNVQYFLCSIHTFTELNQIILCLIKNGAHSLFFLTTFSSECAQ